MNKMHIRPGQAIAVLILSAVWAVALTSTSAECIASEASSSSASRSLELAVLQGEGTVVLSKLQDLQQAFSLHPLSCSEDAAGEEEIEIDTRRKALLMPLEDVADYKRILDISPDPAEYIPGAISIPYTQFLLSGGALKTAAEMAEILGRAGISQNDDLLIYGECQPCGGGPSAATYVYWIMKYLGQQNVSLLDGGIDDWVQSGKPTASSPSHLMATNYTPRIQADLLASYQILHSGGAQIIDARTAEEFEAGSIPASINIPYDRVLDGKKIKDDAALRSLFSSLDKERPVVVYTNTGVKASMIWLALRLLDYDAAIYSWKDWQANSAS